MIAERYSLNPLKYPEREGMCWRVPAQTGISYGANGAGAGGRQIQFVVADAGGLLDPASVNILYNAQVSGTGTTVLDDGHPFTRVQISINGA
jgi:hypothetical protein